MNADPEEGLCILVSCAFSLYWTFKIENIWLLLAVLVAVTALFSYLSIRWMDDMDALTSKQYEDWSRRMNEQSDKAMEEIRNER